MDDRHFPQFHGRMEMHGGREGGGVGERTGKKKKKTVGAGDGTEKEGFRALCKARTQLK